MVGWPGGARVPRGCRPPRARQMLDPHLYLPQKNRGERAGNAGRLVVLLEAWSRENGCIGCRLRPIRDVRMGTWVMEEARGGVRWPET